MIRDFIEALFQEKAGPLDQRQKKILNILHENTRALIEESSSVVYYNQMRLGEFYLKKEPIDLVGLVEKIIKRDINESLSRGVKVVYTTSQKEIKVEADQVKLSGALYSLLTHVMILADKNSAIRIFSRSSRYSRFAKLTLKYSGRNMPKLEKISQDNLDIYVAAKIIMLHHGQIDFLRSEEGEQKIIIVLPTG